MSLALLLQPRLAGRVLILVFAATAAFASGRKLSPFMTVTVMASIIGANLLVPLGRITAEFGPLIITEIALLEGIKKAVTFEALIFISKACLGPGLRLPGRPGSLFAEAFRIYDRILEHRSLLGMKTFMIDIDEILNSVYYGGATRDAESYVVPGDPGTRHHTIDPGRTSRKGDRLLLLGIGLLLLTFLI
jgi:hypothetical protein